MVLKSIQCSIISPQSIPIQISPDSTQTTKEICKAKSLDFSNGLSLGSGRVGGNFNQLYSWGVDECTGESEQETNSEYLLEYDVVNQDLSTEVQITETSLEKCIPNEYYRPGPVCSINTSIEISTTNNSTITKSSVYFIAYSILMLNLLVNILLL